MSYPVALSFVIPLYNSAETIGPLVRDIEALNVVGGHEIILVNDGSRDGTAAVCRELISALHGSRSRTSSTRGISASTTLYSPDGDTRGAGISLIWMTTDSILRVKQCGYGNTLWRRGPT